MMRICRQGEEREVTYPKERFELLRRLREWALGLMTLLESKGIRTYVHGSVARGDVDEWSDIDIVIPKYVSPAILDTILMSGGYEVLKKMIVQATPSSTPKVYYIFDEKETRVLSYPLRELTSNELYFYRFGGMLDSEGLRKGLRVKGVDKRLMLIKPLEHGHREECILGRTGYAARELGIPEAIVNERVYILSKRMVYGRTGVFLEYVLRPGEDIASAVRELSITNKKFREALERR